jgi:alpha-L-fucosidase
MQPGILVNNRIGVPADLDTPEQHIAESEVGRGWETCMTVGDSAAWGYARHNPNRKTLAQLLQNLSRTAAGAGNFLLNVGPRGDGSIPEEDALRLREIGAWLDVHGEAIYGSERVGEKTTNHFQGVFSRKGKSVYLHVFRWSTPEIVIPLLKSTPRRISLLTTGAELQFTRASNGRLIISGLPTFPPHPCQSVIKLEFDSEPELMEEADHAAWLEG